MFEDLKRKEYRELGALCFAFGRLPRLEQEIVEYLFQMDAFEGNFSELTRALNHDAKKLASNVRRACFDLERRCMVCICFKRDENDDLTHSVEAIFLVDGWQNGLVSHDDKTTKSWHDLYGAKRTY